MVTDTVKTTWANKMAFVNHIGDHTLRIDTGLESGDDSGPRPKRTLLATLAACTGMDVVSVLRKMRVPFTGLEIDTEGDLTDEHPIVYSEIRLVYRVMGDDLDKEKIQRAIDLSQEKYCGISAMLKKSCPILYTIVYQEPMAVEETPEADVI